MLLKVGDILLTYDFRAKETDPPKAIGYVVKRWFGQSRRYIEEMYQKRDREMMTILWTGNDGKVWSRDVPANVEESSMMKIIPRKET